MCPFFIQKKNTKTICKFQVEIYDCRFDHWISSGVMDHPREMVIPGVDRGENTSITSLGTKCEHFLKSDFPFQKSSFR